MENFGMMFFATGASIIFISMLVAMESEAGIFKNRIMRKLQIVIISILSLSVIGWLLSGMTYVWRMFIMAALS